MMVTLELLKTIHSRYDSVVQQCGRLTHFQLIEDWVRFTDENNNNIMDVYHIHSTKSTIFEMKDFHHYLYSR